MRNKTIAVDLDSGNLLWLRARALAAGRRNLSDVLNEVIARARSVGDGESPEIMSVVGRARICEEDPDLLGADSAIRALFEESHERFAE